MHKDIAGEEIKVGDFIVYTALAGRSAVMRFGRVVDLKERDASLYGPKDKIPTLRVITAEASWSQKGRWNLQKKGGVVTLGFLDRLLVVNGDVLPRGAWEVLRERE